MAQREGTMKCEAEDQGGWRCCPNEAVYQTRLIHSDGHVRKGPRNYYCAEHRVNRHVWKPDEELEPLSALDALPAATTPEPSQPAAMEPPTKVTALADEIAAALNRYSCELESNTPDFILAKFMLGCLQAWDNAVRNRERWYGRDPNSGPVGTISTLVSAPAVPAPADAPRWTASIAAEAELSVEIDSLFEAYALPTSAQVKARLLPRFRELLRHLLATLPVARDCAPAVPAPADADEPSVIGADIAPVPFTKADVLSEAEHQAMDGDVGERCAMMLRLLANILWPQSAPADAPRWTTQESLEQAIRAEVFKIKALNGVGQLQLLAAILPLIRAYAHSLAAAPSGGARLTDRENLERGLHAWAQLYQPERGLAELFDMIGAPPTPTPQPKGKEQP